MGLKLKRKAGQSIIVSNEIVITISEVRKNIVCIDIEGPREIPAGRFETHINIDKNRCLACWFYDCRCGKPETPVDENQILDKK